MCESVICSLTFHVIRPTMFFSPLSLPFACFGYYFVCLFVCICAKYLPNWPFLHPNRGKKFFNFETFCVCVLCCLVYSSLLSSIILWLFVVVFSVFSSLFVKREIVSFGKTAAMLLAHVHSGHSFQAVQFICWPRLSKIDWDMFAKAFPTKSIHFIRTIPIQTNANPPKMNRNRHKHGINYGIDLLCFGLLCFLFWWI